MADARPTFTIALAGNPNCGKTVVFNALTGSQQRVGNWSGVTVEKKTGTMIYGGDHFNVVDLPGLYSLGVQSEQAIDEQIACKFLLNETVDVIVNVIDGNNLERNLYLTQQLLELKIPMIIAVNMLDVLQKHGMELNLKELSRYFDCPVIGLVARQNHGIDHLKKAIKNIATQPHVSNLNNLLPQDCKNALHELTQMLEREKFDGKRFEWWSLRLLENDFLAWSAIPPSLKPALREIIKQTTAASGLELDIVIANTRYEICQAVVEKVMRQISTKRKDISIWIDRLVLNRYFGIPFFLCMMYFMFLFAINIAGVFQDFFDITSTALFVNGFAHLMMLAHLPAWLIAILAHGVGKGINTTLTFIPVIGGFFLFLSILEDSGYMARAAFVMDRLMRMLGLPGKAFVPMIVGFGCNVPAVMGARTLQNPQERILTAMMMPFMSCGARLAIFAVFATAFFQKSGAEIIFILYVTGIVAAILTGWLLRKTLMPGEAVSLVMELPPYHVPKWNVIFRTTGQRLKSFLSRAGRVIIPVCILIGTLNSITIHGKLVSTNSQSTILATTGQVITPVFAPMGIEQSNWPATVGLVTGVLAKEVVIGTLNTLYSQTLHINPVADDLSWGVWHGLRDALISIPQNIKTLGGAFRNPVVANEPPHDMNTKVYGVMEQQFHGNIGAFSYLLFVLLYFPCISTLAALKREIGSGWGYFSMFWCMVLAYASAVLVYQWGTFAQHPGSTLIWTATISLGFVILIWILKLFSTRSSQALQVHHDFN